MAEILVSDLCELSSARCLSAGFFHRVAMALCDRVTGSTRHRHAKSEKSERSPGLFAPFFLFPLLLFASSPLAPFPSLFQ
jgi:hypothetical protein